MSIKQLPLGFTDVMVPAGSHIAFPYTGEGERADPLFAFVKAGLENGEKCIAAVCEYTRPFWIDSLRRLGVDVDAAVGGQLIILTSSDVFPIGGTDPVGTLARKLGETLRASSEQDWLGARLCTSVTSFLQKPDTAAELLKAEAELSPPIDDQPTVRLCTVGKRCLNERVLDVFLKSHPLLTDGERLSPNPDCLDSDCYLRELPGLIEELRAAGALDPPFACLDFIGDTPVVSPHGEMDFYTAPRVEELGDSLVMFGHNRLVVDLSHTSFLDAAAIGTLLKMRNLAGSKGGRLTVYDPTSPPRKIFQLVYLERYIPIRVTLDEAIRELEEERAGTAEEPRDGSASQPPFGW